MNEFSFSAALCSASATKVIDPAAPAEATQPAEKMASEGTPALYPSKRDVSPLGASRFERPYRATSRRTNEGSDDRYSSTASNLHAATPLSSISRSGGITIDFLDFSFPAPPSTQSVPRSRTAELNAATMETACTAAGCDDYTYLRWRGQKGSSSIESPVEVVSPDDWFARFHSQDSLDLSSEISKEDVCPDRVTLAAVKDIQLYDSEGRSRSFGSLYDPVTATHERQLIIFVRHFFCGACQAYLKALTAGISISDYFCIPVPTSIIIIGCGQPNLIPHYKTFTGCPFAMFTDPSRKLFKKLGMTTSLNVLGKDRPDYMKEISPLTWAGGQFSTIRRTLKDPDGIRKRDVFKGGNIMQVGGEFLFEGGEVVFCHRMRSYRDHTEIHVLRQLLELDE